MNSEEIKSVALAIIELRLSEGISLSVNQTGSQPVSQSFSQSVKILRENSVQYNFLKISYQLSERLNGWYEGLAIPNQSYQDITK